MADIIIRLTWTETGDFFDIKSENSAFGEWFVEQCQQLGNAFICKGNHASIDRDLLELKDNIEEVNQFLRQISFPEIPVFDDLFDQHNLNLTHKNWIAGVRKHPRINRLIYFRDEALFEKFHDINLLVHKIEQSFKYKLDSTQPWRVDNKFANTMPTNGIFNVSVDYIDWGKSSWHKFLDGMDQPNDFELSNWENIGSHVTINLCRPYKLAFSPDYLDYCDQNQIAPTVNTWPIGNLVDHKDTLSKARTIMHKNLQISNNHLEFSIK